MKLTSSSSSCLIRVVLMLCGSGGVVGLSSGVVGRVVLVSVLLVAVMFIALIIVSVKGKSPVWQLVWVNSSLAIPIPQLDKETGFGPNLKEVREPILEESHMSPTELNGLSKEGGTTINMISEEVGQQNFQVMQGLDNNPAQIKESASSTGPTTPAPIQNRAHSGHLYGKSLPKDVLEETYAG
ncbi:unnamed protein product [Ilex paraguariensis]|uniref:Uncharacterized protein n=1 Tax=Ilex paraguariensis TaxID=185542 RepID=A0ABC8RGX8_9AQUA